MPPCVRTRDRFCDTYVSRGTPGATAHGRDSGTLFCCHTQQGAHEGLSCPTAGAGGRAVRSRSVPPAAIRFKLVPWARAGLRSELPIGPVSVPPGDMGAGGSPLPELSWPQPASRRRGCAAWTRVVSVTRSRCVSAARGGQVGGGTPALGPAWLPLGATRLGRRAREPAHPPHGGVCVGFPQCGLPGTLSFVIVHATCQREGIPGGTLCAGQPAGRAVCASAPPSPPPPLILILAVKGT